MRLYNSFLIRCWLIRSPSEVERAIFDGEHIQTGARVRAASLGEIQEWLRAACQTARTEAETHEETERAEAMRKA